MSDFQTTLFITIISYVIGMLLFAWIIKFICIDAITKSLKEITKELKKASDEHHTLLEIIAKAELANYRQVVITDKLSGIVKTIKPDELIESNSNISIELIK